MITKLFLQLAVRYW
uniref:Uncharacterized protein n=1 Tax=Arundo donax TaxID=35708 RepID=A0A0A9APU2_ARUDO